MPDVIATLKNAASVALQGLTDLHNSVTTALEGLQNHEGRISDLENQGPVATGQPGNPDQPSSSTQRTTRVQGFNGTVVEVDQVVTHRIFVPEDETREHHLGQGVQGEHTPNYGDDVRIVGGMPRFAGPHFDDMLYGRQTQQQNATAVVNGNQSHAQDRVSTAMIVAFVAIVAVVGMFIAYLFLA